MKHLILLLTSLFLITLVSAQPSLQVLDHNNNVVTGKTITIYNNDYNAALLSLQLKVQNTGNADLNVFTYRKNNIVAAGSANSFCFGVNCYPPFVDTSKVVTPIRAGAIDTSFLGDYYPYGALGVSSVTYIFYDNTTFSSTVSASVTVNYAVAPIELFDTAGNQVNGSVISVLSSDTSSASLLNATVKVKNNSGSDLVMFVHRISNTVVPYTSNSFCFGVCYPPTTDTSTVSVTIPNRKEDSTFLADYYPNGNGGTTSLTYEFYDNGAFGSPLVASFTVNFTLKGVGVPDISKTIFNGPFPNPSSDFTTFNYTLPADISNAYLIIRNMLGIEIQRVLLSRESGKAIVNTSQLQSGMYVYSLIMNGNPAFTRKLVVKH